MHLHYQINNLSFKIFYWNNVDLFRCLSSVFKKKQTGNTHCTQLFDSSSASPWWAWCKKNASDITREKCKRWIGESPNPYTSYTNMACVRSAHLQIEQKSRIKRGSRGAQEHTTPIIVPWTTPPVYCNIYST